MLSEEVLLELLGGKISEEEFPDEELSEEELSEELPPAELSESAAPVMVISKFCDDVRLPSLAKSVNDSVTVWPDPRLLIAVSFGE